MYIFVAVIVWVLTFVTAEFVPTFKVDINENAQGRVIDVFSFDNSSHMILLREQFASMSYDGGSTWTEIRAMRGANIRKIYIDPLESNRAFVFTSTDTQFVTNDKGRTWSRFTIHNKSYKRLKRFRFTVTSNVANHNMVLLHATDHRKKHSYYFFSTDGGKTVELLPGEPDKCVFAMNNPPFALLEQSSTIICARSIKSSYGNIIKSELVKTIDFFHTETKIDHPVLHSGRIMDLFVSLAFIGVAIQTDRYRDSSTVLLVSKDAENFDKADLDISFTPALFSVLDLEPLSLFLAVQVPEKSHLGRGLLPLAILYSSDSSGLHFTKLMDRIAVGYTQRLHGVDGVWFTAVNYWKSPSIVREQLTHSDYPKDLTRVTKVSIDNGKSWHFLKVVENELCKLEDGCSLHVRTFHMPSKRTPNIVVAMGNTGKGQDGNDSDADMYISRDGGLTWKLAIPSSKGSTFLSFGDNGNVMVAFPSYSDENAKGKVYYSLDQGLSWKLLDIKLPYLKGTLHANGKLLVMYNSDPYRPIYIVDLSGRTYNRQCEHKDYEKIYARDGLCINGLKQYFLRRIAESQCFSNTLQVEMFEEPCECTPSDFECSVYFRLSGGVCVPNEEKIRELCRDRNTIKVPDKQMMDGNKCITDQLSSFITVVDLQCSDYQYTTGVLSSVIEIPGKIEQYEYVEFANMEGVVFIRTHEGTVYFSTNGGSSFSTAVNEKVVHIWAGPKSIILTTEEDYFFNFDGIEFSRLNTPGKPDLDMSISFHPTERGVFIWVSGKPLNYTTFATYNGGASFIKIISDTMKCEFDLKDSKTIYCTVNDGTHVSLIESLAFNFSPRETKAMLTNISSFFVLLMFSVVAITNKLVLVKDHLLGFSPATLPSGFDNGNYTILDSGKSVFIHAVGEESDAILKSGSIGNLFVTSLDNVNRNFKGIDFERVEEFEVLVANTKDPKTRMVKTHISFNDGGLWSYIEPPKVDSDRNEYSCSGKPLNECSLHLRGLTEQHTLSSSVGLMIGVGSVGEALERTVATFLSIDGGIKWKEIRKGPHHWAYGDQGSILVIAPLLDHTNHILYLMDYGTTWTKHKFSEDPVVVQDIITTPLGSSRKFVIFAENNSKVSMYSVDFTSLYSRQCLFDLDHPENFEYEYWSRILPHSHDMCFLGEETHRLRRTIDSDCYVGGAPLGKAKITKKCHCTKHDYECDFMYIRNWDGKCTLPEGVSLEDRKLAMCNLPNTIAYFEPTGYRKITLSICFGGFMDPMTFGPCPGHEREFNKYRTKGGVVFVVVMSISLFTTTIWFVYDKGIRRNGGFKRLGRIRLGDDAYFDPIERNFVDKVVNWVVRVGVAVADGAVDVSNKIRTINFETVAETTISLWSNLRRIDFETVAEPAILLWNNFLRLERWTSSLFDPNLQREYVRIPESGDVLGEDENILIDQIPE